MMSISRLMTKQLAKQALQTSNVAASRSMYMPSYYNIDLFDRAKGRIQADHTPNTNNLKTTITNAIKSKDTKIFTEDLRIWLHLAKTEEDVNLLIDAVKKYHQQNAGATVDYNFGAPLMRLLYTLDKTDLALQLYMSDAQEILFENSALVACILANKLHNNKRYDDVWKVFKKALTVPKKEPRVPLPPRPGSELTKLPLDLIRIVGESLLEKNTPDALENAKELLALAESKDPKEKIALSDTTVVSLILLSVNQNKPEIGFELIPRIKLINNRIKNNLRALCLAGMGRVDEAFTLVENLMLEPMDVNPNAFTQRLRGKLFRTTVNVLKDAVAKAPNSTEKQTKLDAMIAKINQENLFMTMDLKEYVTMPVYFNRIRREQEMLRRQNQQAGGFPQQQQQMGGAPPQGGFAPRPSFGGAPPRAGGFAPQGGFANRGFGGQQQQGGFGGQQQGGFQPRGPGGFQPRQQQSGGFGGAADDDFQQRSYGASRPGGFGGNAPAPRRAAGSFGAAPGGGGNQQQNRRSRLDFDDDE